MTLFNWVINSLNMKRRDVHFVSFDFKDRKAREELRGYFYSKEGVYSVAEVVLVGEGRLRDWRIESMGVHGVVYDKKTKKFGINKHFHNTMSAYYKYHGVLKAGVDFYKRENEGLSDAEYFDMYQEKFVGWLPQLFDMLYNLLYKYMLSKGETI